MSVGRSPSLRMLECPPVQGSVEDRATVILTEEIHTIIGRVARCGVNTGSLGRFKGEIFCMYHCSLVACPNFPPLPRLSVYCIHGDLRDIALKTRLVTIRRNLLSLVNVKTYCKLSVLSQAGRRVTVQLTLSLRTEERKIVNCHRPHAVEHRGDLIQLSEIIPNYTFLKMFFVLTS